MVHLTLESISKKLTHAIIDKAFKLKTNSIDTVQNIEVFPAAPVGEGLLGAVYRIKVCGNTHIASFIAKGLVADALLRKTLGVEEYSAREVLFFAEILPILKQVQKSSGAKERIQDNLPIFYDHNCDGLNDFILMEDLADSHFESISYNPTLRQRDLNLKTIAHLHAVSFVHRLKHPEEFLSIGKRIPEVYFVEKKRLWYNNYQRNAFAIAKDVLSQYEDPKSVYYTKFVELMDNEPYKQIMACITSWGDHPVFCHGDTWCPNFLCAKDKAAAIDFQLYRCASPLTDVAFFILLSTNLCRSKDDFMAALKIYYDGLCYYLKDMGVVAGEVFTWDDVLGELMKYGRFGILAGVSTLVLQCSNRCDNFGSFETKYAGYEKIPLEELWPLSPIVNFEQKMKIVNCVRVAVDVGLI